MEGNPFKSKFKDWTWRRKLKRIQRRSRKDKETEVDLQSGWYMIPPDISADIQDIAIAQEKEAEEIATGLLKTSLLVHSVEEKQKRPLFSHLSVNGPIDITLMNDMFKPGEITSGEVLYLAVGPEINQRFETIARNNAISTHETVLRMMKYGIYVTRANPEEHRVFHPDE